MKEKFLLPVVLAGLALAGCSRGVAPKPAAVFPVLVAHAVVTNVPVLIDPPPVGHVTPCSTVTVHSQIQGLISEVHFQEGQEVRKGDPLFTIDSRPSEAALAQARANLVRDSGQLEYARANYARDQKLFASKIVSQNQLETDQASLDAATGTVAADKAAITNAVLNLGYCDIRSPVDGKTGALQAFVGNVIKAPDDTLVTINQLRPIYVAFAVPEQYLPQIQSELRTKKLKVSVTYENLKGAAPQGELTFVDNSVDPSTGTIQLRATFPNDNEVLWPGQFVEVTLTLLEMTNVIAVPSQAVQTGQDGDYIYVVKPDQTIEVRTVTAGITYENETVISQGLQAGDVVVTDGQLRLSPGAKVSVKTSIAPAASASATNAP